MAGSWQSLPLPDDPTLAAWASAMNESGYWAYVLDATWRIVFVTDDVLLSFPSAEARTAMPVGHHYFSATAAQFRELMLGGSWAVPEFRRAVFSRWGNSVLASAPGGRDELRGIVDPELVDLVEDLEPEPVPLADT